MVVPNKKREEQKCCTNISHIPPKWLYPGEYNWMCPECGLVSCVVDGKIMTSFVLIEIKNEN